MQQNLQNKKGLVENVFNQVYNKYDLMNDFMSMGIHRYWKKSLINMMNPRDKRKLIDVACGTGDVGILLLTDFLLPFEIISLLLLGALIGAAVLSRGKS